MDDPTAQILRKKIRRGIAHGWFGDVVLLLGSIFSILGIIMSPAATVLFLTSESWENAFRAFSLAFSCTLAYVIIQRVPDK